MGAITDPPGHPGYGPDVLTVTNPSYAAYLETTAGKIIAEQAAEIKALLAENERLAKDAARYRWLRERINWKELEIRSGQLSTQYRSWEHQDYRKDRPVSEHIDEYIDAALAGKP